MCGLFGWVGNLTRRERLILATVLADANDDRGGQSWGYIGSHSGSLVRRRGLGLLLPQAKRLARHRTLMAHTRFATVGKVSVENCHPFRRGKVYLAHNGGVYNHWQKEDVDVDSELIAMRVARGDNLHDLEGYGAVTYTHDKRPGEVRIANIGNGDMACCAILDGWGKVRATVWTSSERALQKAVRALGEDASPRHYMVDEHKVYAARADGLWDIGKELRISERSWVYSGYGSRWNSGSEWSKDEKTGTWHRTKGTEPHTTSAADTAPDAPQWWDDEWGSYADWWEHELAMSAKKKAGG